MLIKVKDTKGKIIDRNVNRADLFDPIFAIEAFEPQQKGDCEHKLGQIQRWLFASTALKH